MQWIELQNVGFGDCSVIGGRHQDILMVDCGSLNRMLSSGISFDQLTDTMLAHYGQASERSFLLTHFHRDHYSGLLSILSKDPGFFDRIYLPACLLDSDGKARLIELNVMIECFVTGPGMETVKMNAASIRSLQKICSLAGTESIYALRAGDVLEFDGSDYRVLWPPAQGYPFREELISCLQTAEELLLSSRDPAAQAFLEMRDLICHCYRDCMDAFSFTGGQEAQQRAAGVARLNVLIDEMNELLPRLHTLKTASRVRDLLCRHSFVSLAGKEINGTSLILSSDRLLFTGDAAPETLDRIRPQLQDSYYAVKAPHHGTETYWWDGIQNLEIEHVLISNGQAKAGGPVSQKYAQLNAVKHCTNWDHCAYFREHDSCCNENIYCARAPQSRDIRTCAGNPCSIFSGDQIRKNSCCCEFSTTKRVF